MMCFLVQQGSPGDTHHTHLQGTECEPDYKSNCLAHFLESDASDRSNDHREAQIGEDLQIQSENASSNWNFTPSF